jgi:hypothetical protein
MKWKQTTGAILGACLVGILVVFGNIWSTHDIAHEAIQLHLRLLAASIYEYHEMTGEWPTRVQDLERTTLEQRSPHWRVVVDAGTNVIVWHRDLKPDPKDNAGVVLTYHNRGLLAWLGRKWVCFGDLRTEYVRSGELEAMLKKAGEQ